MNLDRISLYLAGKLPPYYQAPFDKLELLEIIRADFYQNFTDDLFKLIDSESFYSMALNKVKRQDTKDGTAKLKKIVRTLNIKEDAGGFCEKDLRSEKLAELKKELEEMENMKKGTEKERGKKFELWFIQLLELFALSPKHDIKDGVDQVDGSFLLNGQIYIFEIEWTEQYSNKNYIVEVSDKASKLKGTFGVAISYTGFTKPSFQKVEKSSRKNTLMMTGQDIKKVLDEEISLDDLILKIKRRGAEEGKPYLN